MKEDQSLGEKEHPRISEDVNDVLCSFDLPSLSSREATAYKYLRRAAAAGAPCPTNVELCVILNAESLSTPPEILNRLERLRLISVERYRRSRRVLIVATGQQTAPVRNTAPQVPRSADAPPTPSLAALTETAPTLAARIIAAAHEAGVQPADFLTHLVLMGWDVRCEKIRQARASIQTSRDQD